MRVTAGITVTLAALTAAVGAASPAGAAPAVGCGSVVTKDLTLQSDLAYCVGDGLIVGKAGITINLNGHLIYSWATHSSSLSPIPGSAGIRNPASRGSRSTTRPVRRRPWAGAARSAGSRTASSSPTRAGT